MSNKIKVLIACEFSGVVRDAFIKRGFNAMSCDLIPTKSPGPHYEGDVFDIINDGWDLMIAHPPCTYLSVSGNKWFYHPDDKHLPVKSRRPHPRFPDRRKHQENAVKFFMSLAEANIDRVCIENPVGRMSTFWCKPNQIIQPYHFGHVEAKKTCLWLKGLPLLESTSVKEPEYVTFKSGKRMAKWYVDAASLPPKERSALRSKTFQGIADAMANQWGNYILKEMNENE